MGRMRNLLIPGVDKTLLVRDVNAVPEPASIALMATGIIGVGIVARRRRRNLTQIA